MTRYSRASCATDLPDAATAPEEILLIPAGEVPTRPHDGRPPWRNDIPSAVIAASRELRADLPVDYDHQLETAAKAGGTAPAAGWVTALFERAGAIWGRVQWTERARAAIESREYRFISPTFDFDRGSRRITRLVSAALTNDPAFFMRALAAAGGGHADTGESSTMDETLKQIAADLGLAEDADAAAVQAAVAALKSGASEAAATVEAVAAELADDAEDPGSVPREGTALASRVRALKGDGTPDPSRYVPIAEHRALGSRVAALEARDATARATAAVDRAIADGKVTPAGRAWAMAYAAKDPDGFADFVRAQPAIVRPGRHRSEGGTPAEGALTVEERAVCRATGISEDDYKRTRDADRAAARAGSEGDS